MGGGGAGQPEGIEFGGGGSGAPKAACAPTLSGDRDWRVRCPFMSLTTHSVRIGVNWGPQNADELQVTQPDFTLGSLYMVLPQPPLT